MTTGTVADPNGISALDSGLTGCTLPAGTYVLHPHPGEPAFAYVRHPATGKWLIVGRNDPGLVVDEVSV